MPSHPDREPRRAAAWTAAALALVLALVATFVVVALNPRVSGQEYVATSTTALDFMSATHPTALIGGEYSLDPAASFERADGLTTVAAGTSSSPAVALVGTARATDIVTTLAVASLEPTTDEVSAAVIGRSGAYGAYRASVTIRHDGSASLVIERTGRAPGVLASAPLPSGRDWSINTLIELTVTGSDDVSVGARVWGAAGTSVPATLHATDSTDGRVLSGQSGYGAWQTGSAGASVRIDSFRAFALKAIDPTQPDSAGAVPLREAPSASSTAETLARAGAAIVGSTAYQVPTGAIVVSPGGNDGARGTMTDPVRTVKEAVAIATPGATIVLRAGTYHESVVVPPGSHLTIQSAPGEAAWFDGSSTVTGWREVDGAWEVDGWETVFDSSPTYTAGAPDGTADGWSFLNEDNPMAANPDQVWIDDLALTQVASRAEVVDGTFFVDYDAQTLTIGSDPSRRTVRASDRELAISLRSTDSTLRGVGVRRFSPSVPQLGAVRAEEASATIENVAILDSATTGLFVREPHSRISHVTVARSGMLGIAVSYADDLRFNDVVSVDNNTEGFNPSPVSGGMKITRSREVAVVDSVFARNAGPGLWFDESIYDGIATGNHISDNLTHGLVLEISSKFVVANNVINDNGQNGIKVNNTDEVQVWNNTLFGNGKTINIVQDGRRAANPDDAGHDKRQPFPDPTMSWIINDIVVSNNVLAASTGKCLLCVEDFSKEYTAEQLGVIAEGNVYQRGDATSPSWIVVWSRGVETNPAVFTTLAQFRDQTTLEANGLDLIGARAVDDSGMLEPDVADRVGGVASPVPSDVARLIGQPAGSRAVGAWSVVSGG